MVVRIEGCKSLFPLVWYGKVVETASKVHLKERFMEDHINSNADVSTDYWSGNKENDDHFPKLTGEKLKEGRELLVDARSEDDSQRLD